MIAVRRICGSKGASQSKVTLRQQAARESSSSKGALCKKQVVPIASWGILIHRVCPQQTRRLSRNEEAPIAARGLSTSKGAL